MARRGQLITEFIKRFVSGNLGRKRQHGARYVVDCDHCQILMLQTGDDTEQVLGLRFSNGSSLFESTRHTGAWRGDLGGYSPEYYMNITRAISGKDITESKFIAQKLIEFKDKNVFAMLFELAGEQYLLDYTPKEEILNAIDKIMYSGNVYKSYLIRAGWANFESKIYKLPERVSSVEDARTVILPDFARENPTSSNYINGTWINKMPEGFEPESCMAEADLKILRNPPVEGVLIDPVILKNRAYFNTAEAEESCTPTTYQRIIEHNKYVNEYELCVSRFKTKFSLDRFNINYLTLKGSTELDAQVITDPNNRKFVKGIYYNEGGDIIYKCPDWHELYNSTLINYLETN